MANKHVEMGIVDGQRRVGECNAPALDPDKRSNQWVRLAKSELGGVELGNEVVHIEDDLRAFAFRRQRGKHQEVRHRMDLHDVDALAPIEARHLPAGCEKKGRVAREVAKRARVRVAERTCKVEVDPAPRCLALESFRFSGR